MKEIGHSSAMDAREQLQPVRMPIEDLAMLESLLRVDGGAPMDKRRPWFGERLVAMLLAESDGDSIRLTAAGIERCRSLQHRLASDNEAERLLSTLVVGSR